MLRLAADVGSESGSFLGTWQFVRPRGSLRLQNNLVMLIRKHVICFFLENHSAPPDVTTYTSEHPIQVERPQGSTTSRTAPKYGNAELMETGDGRSPGSRDSFRNPLPCTGPEVSCGYTVDSTCHVAPTEGGRGTRNANYLHVGQECFRVGKNISVVGM